MDNSLRAVDDNRSLRFWRVVLALSTIFWLGGLTMRAMIANEFFIPGTLEFHPEIMLPQERTLFQLISASSILVMSSYLVVFISTIIVLRKTNIPLKKNGWLLMAPIMFFLFVPVEVFTGYLDIKFILLWEKTKHVLELQGMSVYEEYSTIMRETLSHRIGALSGLPVMATLSYFTAVIIIAWQPLKIREK